MHATISQMGLGAMAMACVALLGVSSAQEKSPSQPAQVTITDVEATVVEPVLPIDPVQRIVFQPQMLGVAVRGPNNEQLHLSHFPSLNIDGQVLQQGQGGKVDFDNRPLPKNQAGKARQGFTSSHIFNDGIRVTLTVTLVPTKPQDKSAKRRMDAVLIHYLIENQGKNPHKVGLRIYMDTYVIDNDGCLFAAPTLPGKILDGMVLKDKDLPPYVQMLQRPDLKNPMFVAHLALNPVPKLEKPSSVVLTRHGAGLGAWDMPAINAGGDSALGVFWEPKELKPGAKREIAYGYGQGIATSPESDGLFELALAGSFEPGKTFTVTAYVVDPAPGQTLTLELPAGMKLAEGKAVQAVPELQQQGTNSVVMWRASVQRPGDFPVRVRSSTGVTQGKLVTVK